VDRKSYPRIDGIWWNDGARFKQVIPTPIGVSLKPLEERSPDHGPMMPALFLGPIPLFREDFIASLKAGGLDNLDFYEARITDPDTGAVFSNYKAVNVIGIIAAADMGRSTATVHDGIPLVDVEFDELVVDEDKTGGMLMFRLAENNSAILVHERLRDHLLAANFDGLEFHNLDEVAL